MRLNKRVRAFSGSISFVYLSDHQILFNEKPLREDPDGIFIVLESEVDWPTAAPIFELLDFFKLKYRGAEKYSVEELQFIQLYLPYCFLTHWSRTLGRCIVVTHFAQSLDGKIATTEGDSRWIGNDENLDHAHRMRALCQGIVVGTNTVRNDQPQLTVRRVEGDNPQRIVLGSSAVDLSSLIDCCTDPILVVSNQADYASEQVEMLRVPSDNCRIHSLDLLKILFEKGIYSIYVEGGAMTTSNFLADQAIDVLQLHIAPLIFGSGKQGVVLPQINSVTESQRFTDFDFYHIGDSIMFVGRI